MDHGLIEHSHVPLNFVVAHYLLFVEHRQLKEIHKNAKDLELQKRISFRQMPMLYGFDLQNLCQMLTSHFGRLLPDLA